MAKFKCRGQRARQQRKKILQQRGIGFQIRRQLEQHRPQLACGSKRLNRRQEARNKVFGPLEPLDVRDHLMCLDTKTEMRWSLLNPVLDGAFFHQLPEGEVHLNRVKLRGVMAEKLFLREFGRVEVGLPCWISPPGSTDK